MYCHSTQMELSNTNTDSDTSTSSSGGSGEHPLDDYLRNQSVTGLLVRWREGHLMPMGGQSQYTNVVNGVEKYTFASRCKQIHGWYGLNGQYYIAYL